MAIAPSPRCRAKQRSWFKPAMPHRRSRSARSAGRSVRSPRRTASRARRGRTRRRRHAPTAPRGPACANRTPTRTTRTSLHRTATLIFISHEGRRGRLPADARSCLSLLSRELISRRSGISCYEPKAHSVAACAAALGCSGRSPAPYLAAIGGRGKAMASRRCPCGAASRSSCRCP